MQLHFVSREEYRNKENIDFVSRLTDLFGAFFLVPEGGANALGVKGASEIITPSLTLPLKGDGTLYLCCACGTGTTLAGLISSALPGTQYIGFSVLKGKDTLTAEVEKYVGHTNGWHINTDYHCGGYAKTNADLLAFKQRFEEANQIPLDRVYTAKLFYGLYSLINKGFLSLTLKF
ncbi:MAG: hypothetical protein M0D57_04050 [Sphingobacteriales bacterium JAD_PAG50586_3]|nr:MAG: hypothetical protein M0D57_04050 [Sphingobacteriales bacterium JAD_PAG50586_3]